MKEYNELTSLLNNYAEKIIVVGKFYKNNQIPENKLNNAISTYGKSIKKENIIGLIDTTLFGSAKDGMIFTTGGICIKGGMTINNVYTSTYISYDDIKEVKLTKQEKEKDSDRGLEIILKNSDLIYITEYSYNKSILKQLIDEIIKLRNEGKVSTTDKVIAIEYMDDIVKENYIKAIICSMNVGEGIKEKQISELYSLMTQIKIDVNMRKEILKYISEEVSDDINYILDKLDENVVNSSKDALHFSLMKDILRITKCDNSELGYRQNEFINNITKRYNISKEQVKFLNDAIILDRKILSGDIKDSDIVNGMKDLAANAAAVGIPIVAVYLSGSAVGLSAVGITSGLAALGLGGVLGLSSMVTGIGVAILIGVGAYKGIRWITGGSERDKTKQREFLIQEAIKNNQETINNLVEDINAITLTVVELLKDVDKNKLKIDKLSKEISIFSEVFSTLREKGIEFEKVLYAE